MELLIATNNAGKVRELEEILADLPVRLRSLRDFQNVREEPEETGVTFAENAFLKARFYALNTGVTALADDSGLEVEALGGAPGVYSARYAGGASDVDRMERLLNELDATGDERRRARFVCAIAIADDGGEIKFLAEGSCAGSIARIARGANGFGYDPIFIPDGYDETFGELPDGVKRRISHRARAIKKIIGYLRGFTALSLDL